MCIYLDYKQTFDTYLQSRGYIILNNTKIPARCLINLAKKLLLSNVCLIIPREILLQHLKEKIRIKSCSPVVYIGAGYTNPAIKHVFSSRRSVYKNLPEGLNFEIPSSFLIKYEDEEYRIFTNTEENVTCFLCKQVDHIAIKCRNIPTQIVIGEEQDPGKQASPNKRKTPASENMTLIYLI